MSFLGYPNNILYTKFKYFADLSFMSYAPDKQTKRRTQTSYRVLYCILHDVNVRLQPIYQDRNISVTAWQCLLATVIQYICHARIK